MESLQRLAFCVPGTPYFDLPTSQGDDYAMVAVDLPKGWLQSGDREWMWQGPPAVTLPTQGWKIHVSATRLNAERVLDIVWRYCVEAEVSFKYIRGPYVLMRRNGKYGDRTASGKFVTIYPATAGDLERILDELGDALDGEEGPYILTDLRWRSGPLYVRYGAFVLKTVRTETGQLIHCIEDPDGNLVPDRRSPGFHPPAWLEMPAIFDKAVAARNSGSLKDFPYEITQALHFSNGGGVYRGSDRHTGADVLVREARPFAGEDGGGNDAIARQEQELWALEELAGLPVIPAVYALRKGHEHRFLVREYVEGQPLGHAVIRANPLCRSLPGADPADPADPADHAGTLAQDCAKYTDWALDVIEKIQDGVVGMHSRGVIFGDLHPGNILVDDDGAVGFIDLETASRVADGLPQVMGAPGFVAPTGYTGVDVDLYALACVKLSIFVPLTAVLPWGPDKVEQLLSEAKRWFKVPEQFLTGIRDVLLPTDGHPRHVSPGQPVPDVPTPTRAPEPGDQESDEPLWPDEPLADWPRLRAEIAEGIVRSASPERRDRLFPGDAEQLTTPEGAVNLSTGAAGVLWAMDAAGVGIDGAQVRWLADVSLSLKAPHPGLFVGLGGTAVALDRLGQHDDAVALFERIRGTDRSVLTLDLSGGLAGFGLTLLHFSRGVDALLLGEAVEVAELLHRRMTATEGSAAPPPGLLYGRTGAALFFLRLHEAVDEPAYLELAREALAEDVRVVQRHRPVHEGSGSAALPQVPAAMGTGLGGTGVVIDQVLRHGADQRLHDARAEIERDMTHGFYPNVGLFHGRAGVLMASTRPTSERTPVDADVAKEHLRALGLHAVRVDSQLHFLGQEGLRISADLSTGAAGVLLAIEAAAGGRASLPFLEGPS